MDNKYYKLKVIQAKNEIPVSKDKIDLSEFYDSLSFIPVTIKLIEEELDDEIEKVIAYIGCFRDCKELKQKLTSLYEKTGFKKANSSFSNYLIKVVAPF